MTYMEMHLKNHCKADNYVDLAGYAACAAEIAGGKINAD